ncbi:MAG: hypothetical protein BMS9Abin17_0196 [Acidimicrobiia bacterium]|nr:MAG: hypothetical protein BMS9Abin17_0196 [Acidimicrobiia bacterium]
MSKKKHAPQQVRGEKKPELQHARTRAFWMIGGGVAGLALVALFAVVGLSGDPNASNGPSPAVSTASTTSAEPSAAVDVEMEDFNGDVMTIADLKGQPVVVNFWATWCPACFAEMPAFEEVYQAKGDSVQFLGINLSEDVGASVSIVEETGVTYPLVRDPQGEVFAAFGGFGMPTTVFLDETGSVIDMYTGELTADELSARIAEYFES